MISGQGMRHGAPGHPEIKNIQVVFQWDRSHRFIPTRSESYGSSHVFWAKLEDMVSGKCCRQVQPRVIITEVERQFHGFDRILAFSLVQGTRGSF